MRFSVLLLVSLLFMVGMIGSTVIADNRDPVVLVDEKGVKTGARILGGVKWNNSPDGKYLSFDGKEGSRVEIPAGPELDLQNEISISLWFMLTSRPEDDVAVRKSACAAMISRDWNWRCTVYPSLVVKAVMLHDAQEDRIGTCGINLNTWNHAVIIYSRAEKRFCLYVNGVLSYERKNTPLGIMKHRNGPILLGADPSGYNSFSGKLCNVKIYKRALSSADLVQLNQEIPGGIIRKSVADIKKWQQELNGIVGAELNVEARKQLNALRAKIDVLLRLKNQETVTFSETMGSQIVPMSSYSRNMKELQWWQIVLGKLKKSDLSENVQLRVDGMLREIKAQLALKNFTAADFITQNAAIVYALLNQKISLNDSLCYVVPAISNIPIVPESQIDNKLMGNRLQITLTPGEYEPASFVLRPLKDLDALQIQPSILKDAAGNVIPASAIDLKVVKCWYQAGSAWHDIGQCKNQKILVPELLLNDASLVNVDYQKQMNYLRLSFPDGDKYVSICTPEANEKRDRWTMKINTGDYPVKDSTALCPVALTRNRNQQFWLTLKVPENTVPGKYAGKITLSSKNISLGALELTVQVLPFHLASPQSNYDPKQRFTPSIYHVSTINPSSKGGLTPFHKTEEQYLNELKNLYAHGIVNPLCYQLQAGGNLNVFRKVLELREKVGMDKRPLYLSGPESNLGQGMADTPEALAKIQSKVKEILDIVEKAYGHRDVYFYGVDEARGDHLKKQLPAWNAIHKAGGKIFVACCDSKGPTGSFSIVGDIQDLVIYSGVPVREEAAKWHAKNHKIWSYCNPQGGVENPEIYRRNYGLLTYKNNYDGFATYCYYESFGNPWDDFDHITFRDHNLVYPTADGVIDTIAWEGYREGIDDIRYASTLRNAIDTARQSGNPDKKKLAGNADKWLNSIDAEHCNLDAVRGQMIEWILKLH